MSKETFPEEQSEMWSRLTTCAYLQNFVYLANKTDTEMGVTLFIHGSIISGTLIGVKKYTAELSRQFKSSGELGIALAEAVLDTYESEQPEPEDQPIIWPNFIHLKNAKVYSPGQKALPDNGMLWRGKLESVDAWSFGTFES